MLPGACYPGLTDADLTVSPPANACNLELLSIQKTPHSAHPAKVAMIKRVLHLCALIAKLWASPLSAGDGQFWLVRWRGRLRTSPGRLTCKSAAASSRSAPVSLSWQSATQDDLCCQFTL